MQSNTAILFLQEEKGKRKSLAPVRSEPDTKKTNRGNTLKDQEKIIVSWLTAVLKRKPRWGLNSLNDINWKKGDLLFDIIDSIRPELIDHDTLDPKLSPLGKTQFALDISKTCFNIEPMASAAEFVKMNPDHLLILTYLTQIKDAINQAPVPKILKNSPRKSGDKKTGLIRPDAKKSPKKSLEEKLSKLHSSLKRRSQRAPKADNCPFCNEQVFVAERYGSDGFWFHRKCFKCSTCGQLLVFSGGNYKEIGSHYFCHVCASSQQKSGKTENEKPEILSKIQEEEMSEPQRQEIIDTIIETTNVPKPVPLVRIIPFKI